MRINATAPKPKEVIDPDLEDTEGMDEPAFVGGDTQQEPGVKREGTFTIPPVKSDIEPGPQITEPKPGESKPFKTFSTQEEYDAFVESEKNKALADVVKGGKLPQPTQETKPDTPAEPIKFFSDDFKPKDWNEFLAGAINNPIFLKAMVDQMTPDIKDKLSNLTAAEQAELDKVDAELDKQYDDLAKEGKVPARDTEDGKKINIAISKVGADYGIPNMTKAYDLWAKLPVEEGGGYGYMSKKNNFQQRKQASALISGKRNGGNPAPTKPSYKEIRNKSMDELVQEELEKE